MYQPPFLKKEIGIKIFFSTMSYSQRGPLKTKSMKMYIRLNFLIYMSNIYITIPT